MNETFYLVTVHRLGNKTGVTHTFNDFGSALDFYVKKIKQGVDYGFHFDCDIDAGFYDNELQCVVTDRCVAAFTWEPDR